MNTYNLCLGYLRNALGLSANVHLASAVRRIPGSFHSALRAHSFVVAFQPAQPFSYFTYSVISNIGKIKSILSFVYVSTYNK
jgi:hypothetical protein